jgi:hypothetical protein
MGLILLTVWLFLCALSNASCQAPMLSFFVAIAAVKLFLRTRCRMVSGYGKEKVGKVAAAYASIKTNRNGALVKASPFPR